MPDPLYRQAAAALSGRKLKDLVEQGLRLVPQSPPDIPSAPGLADLMGHARGMIDSGVPDLSTNPEHLKGFGRDAGDR